MKMRRGIYQNTVLFSLMLTFGCSAFQEVAVVSHDEGHDSMERPIFTQDSEPAPDPAENVAPVTPLEPASPILPSPTPPEPPSRHITPRVVDPVPEKPMQENPLSPTALDSMLPWTLQDVFFDFDQWRIRKDAIPILEQNARVLLKRYPNRNTLIQGHCDEHGTEAYNLILGERRAKAVKNYLVNLGVLSSQLRTLSLGKSQPFCLARTIPCFRQNRRAHFILK